MYKQNFDLNFKISFILAHSLLFKCDTCNKNYPESKQFLNHLTREHKTELNNSTYKIIRRISHRIAREIKNV